MRAAGWFIGKQGMVPRASLAGTPTIEALWRGVALAIENALGRDTSGRRRRWSAPPSSAYPRAAGGPGAAGGR